MDNVVIISAGFSALAFISSILGLRAAFAAIPPPHMPIQGWFWFGPYSRGI